MRDTGCYWEVSESLWIKSKWSDLDTPWAGVFTFAEFRSYNFAMQYLVHLLFLCIYLAWHQQCIPFYSLTAHPNTKPSAPRARSRASSNLCLAKAGLSFFAGYSVPLKELDQGRAQPTASAVEHQKCNSQNEGEESQGFLSMWQCWNVDKKHNSMYCWVFSSPETQQNFSHVSLMRNRHRDHQHHANIFQRCFNCQLTTVTHIPLLPFWPKAQLK